MGSLLVFALAGFTEGATEDVLFGLNNPTQTQWEVWLKDMKSSRAAALHAARFDPAAYTDPAAAWSDLTYRQYFLFMYDAGFFSDGKYRTREYLSELRRRFGRVDSVLLWHAYPQLGFDRRTQFDFYKEMPRGVAALRRDVVDVLHAEGVRVFIDFNPWDVDPNYDELGDMVALLDADGVMLDTMWDVPPSMRKAVALRKRGVVFAPETHPSDSQLSFARQSWAQWYDLGDSSRPSIYRQKWLAPNHMQFTIRRWDKDRRADILYSFFNGSGMLLWDDVFGTWNPYSASDRELLAQTGAIFEGYARYFSRGKWWPLLPTGSDGLDANRWDLDGRSIYTLRNRTDHDLVFHPPRRLQRSRMPNLAYASFWTDFGDGAVTVAAQSIEVVVLDDPAHIQLVAKRFAEASRLARGDGSDDRVSEHRLSGPMPATQVYNQGTVPDGMLPIPGGSFTMTVTHEKRESGCYPLGAPLNATWGYPYNETITHRIAESLNSFAMRKTAVTNAEFVEFVRATGYQPRDPERFLKHLAGSGTALVVPPQLANLPVTYVSLEDARAYAHWKGERLPTEPEWQWAAEGAGQGNRWPWGNRGVEPSVVNLTGELAPANSYPKGATPQGLLNMTGNAWELTDSEWSNGHTRYVMLRGGVYLPPSSSEWVIPRGPRPNTFHAKYLLLSDGLDRSESISFRTVVDYIFQ